MTLDYSHVAIGPFAKLTFMRKLTHLTKMAIFSRDKQFPTFIADMSTLDKSAEARRINTLMTHMCHGQPQCQSLQTCIDQPNGEPIFISGYLLRSRQLLQPSSYQAIVLRRIYNFNMHTWQSSRDNSMVSFLRLIGCCSYAAHQWLISWASSAALLYKLITSALPRPYLTLLLRPNTKFSRGRQQPPSSMGFVTHELSYAQFMLPISGF